MTVPLFSRLLWAVAAGSYLAWAFAPVPAQENEDEEVLGDGGDRGGHPGGGEPGPAAEADHGLKPADDASHGGEPAGGGRSTPPPPAPAPKKRTRRKATPQRDASHRSTPPPSKE